MVFKSIVKMKDNRIMYSYYCNAIPIIGNELVWSNEQHRTCKNKDMHDSGCAYMRKSTLP